MAADNNQTDRGLGSFEKYLTLWVALCILAGIGLGRIAPGVARYLDRDSGQQYRPRGTRLATPSVPAA